MDKHEQTKELERNNEKCEFYTEEQLCGCKDSVKKLIWFSIHLKPEHKELYGNPSLKYIPECVKRFNNVEYIDFSDAIGREGDIKKIEHLKGMKKLENLDLERQSIEKIEGLDTLEKLKRLNLGRNQISKIEGLDNLVNLEYLDLFYQFNKLPSYIKKEKDIRKIENLDNLKNLRILVLGTNSIKTIKNVNHLTKLTHLNLQDNRISRIKNIENLTNLQSLVVGNYVNEIKNISHLKKLEFLDIEGFVKKIKTIEDLPRIEDVHVKSISKRSPRMEKKYAFDLMKMHKQLIEIGNNVFFDTPMFEKNEETEKYFDEDIIYPEDRKVTKKVFDRKYVNEVSDDGDLELLS